MPTNSSKRSIPILRIGCTLLGHNYLITRKITDHINEYQCSNCGHEVSDSYSGKLEELTVKLKKVNSNVAAFFQKKTRKITA